MIGFSPSCERNKDPILDKLRDIFSDSKKVLEIGSGSGQHAIHFAGAMGHLSWQPSEQSQYFEVLKKNISEYGTENLSLPIAIDASDDWQGESFDGLFTANTLHIMSWEKGQAFLGQVSKFLKPGGVFCVYGAFLYDGQYTSESNIGFDAWLKDRDPLSGIRNFEDVNAIVCGQGFELLNDFTMPANNQLLVWKRKTN